MSEATATVRADPIRLVIADDHLVLLQSLSRLLESQDDMTVVGQAPDADRTLSVVEDLKPDVLVLDLAMPGGGGMRVLRDLSARSTRTLVLSGAEAPDLLSRIMQAGAWGYLPKSIDSDELLRAIRAVAAGNYYFNAPATAGPPSKHLDTLESLSPREREVLVQLALGLTSKEIAAQLDIAQTTVDVYKARLKKKIGAKRRTDLVKFALRAGLLSAHSAG